jgi:hypothetical protein
MFSLQPSGLGSMGRFHVRKVDTLHTLKSLA